MPRGERKDPVWTKLPVPGVVTARRDVTQTLKLRQKRQEEEEQLKKQRRQAEEAARILAHRWRQEDRGEAAGGRRREDVEEDEGREEPGTPGEPRRGAPRREAEPAAAGVWVSTEEPRRPRPPSSRPHKSDAEVERRPPAEVAAAFESPARPEKRRREQRSPSPAVGSRPPRQRREEPAPAPGGRRSPSPGALAGEREAPAPAARPKAKGRSALAGVFGLGDSDEERESTARQMELAAAGRRQTFARRAGIAAAGAPGSSGSAPRGEAPKALDPAEVYMRCSQWKQSCNGKEMPMPEELRRALVEVTGTALGHGAPAPARKA